MKVIHTKKLFHRGYKLQVRSDGTVEVITGNTVNKVGVDKILKKHKFWLNRRLANTKRVVSQKTIKISNGKSIEICGCKYVFDVNRSPGTELIVNIESKESKINILRGSSISSSDIDLMLKIKLREKAREALTSRVEYYTKKYKVNYNRISIKDQRSKWGSCSSKKNLNFSWRLILLPWDMLEYIVIHEVCHLLQMNHSPKFWAEVEKCYPEYKKARKWMRENGQRFMELSFKG